ncbi:MAG TPA: orotidine-5'-phosphate decarboxylase [Afifellaceae bacterium]|nr:orotidine-5'-phosphate decarboxylase [Afifellaceae bacterium]
MSGPSGRIRPRDARDRLIVALDLADVAEAEQLVARLGDAVTFYKVGMQLAFAGGLEMVGRLAGEGKRVFLDMKLLDIDNTVTGAVRSIAALGAAFTTIHAYPNAMRAAVAGRGAEPLGLLGVTVLTSMDDSDLAEAGYGRTAGELVVERASQAAAAGMDGIVCSPREAAEVRAAAGPELVIVTPGVRPAGAPTGDQKRVMTPKDAVRAGADYLVVGRPVSQAREPNAAAEAIIAEIETALSAGGA